MSFEGKVALVTGASRGIGAAILKTLNLTGARRSPNVGFTRRVAVFHYLASQQKMKRRFCSAHIASQAQQRRAGCKLGR